MPADERREGEVVAGVGGMHFLPQPHRLAVRVPRPVELPLVAPYRAERAVAEREVQLAAGVHGFRVHPRAVQAEGFLALLDGALVLVQPMERSAEILVRESDVALAHEAGRFQGEPLLGHLQLPDACVTETLEVSGQLRLHRRQGVVALPGEQHIAVLGMSGRHGVQGRLHPAQCRVALLLLLVRKRRSAPCRRG